MDIVKLTVNQCNALAQAIMELSDKTSDKKPVFKLPFSFTWALSRTYSKLQEALKPVQEKNEEIFDGWEAQKAILNAKIKNADGDELERLTQERSTEFDRRNSRWKEVTKEQIDVEIFRFPRFAKSDLEQIMNSGISPVTLAALEPMDFSLDPKEDPKAA